MQGLRPIKRALAERGHNLALRTTCRALVVAFLGYHHKCFHQNNYQRYRAKLHVMHHIEQVC
jgi:hypothetical protein